MNGILLLEDGRSFVGRGFGASSTRVGEVVFHTAMTGYQEIVTDPSFAEQIITMTAPHIGNTGINLDDPESEKVWASGLVVRKLSRRPSNWRATGDLSDWLAGHGVPGLEGIDTRALVRHIRSHGAMRCVVSTDDTPKDALLERLRSWPGMAGRSLAVEVSCKAPYVLCDPPDAKLRISLVDGGVKRNILRLLEQSGAHVTVHPLTADASTWTDGADLVFFSNGPGDPSAAPSVVEEVKKVLGTKPCVGICLGHQLLALGLGATTYKLPFGHRGGNQPVRDERTGEVAITSQNHGFAVDRQSLLSVGASVTHTHLNDGTVSGFVHPDKAVYAVQYHPEAAPGPHDAQGLFQQFLAFAETHPCR